MASNKANLDKVLNSAARKVVTQKAAAVLPRAKSIAGTEGSTLVSVVRGNSYRDLKAQVGSTDPEFIYLERGTRPHIIRPRNGKTLVFPGLSGKTTHATVVYHPGTRGKHPLRNALRSSNGQFATRSAVTQALRG